MPPMTAVRGLDDMADEVGAMAAVLPALTPAPTSEATAEAVAVCDVDSDPVVGAEAADEELISISAAY